MAVSPVLVDSSFYIRAVRQGKDPLQLLAPLTATRDVAVCGVIRCEVGRGVREPKILERYHSFWNVMVNVPTDNQIWAAVEKMLWRLDRQGTILPLTDVVIACCALRIGAVVLTHDEQFQRIPGVKTFEQII